MTRSPLVRVAWLLVVALLGPVLVVLRTRTNGINVSPDSAAYLAAAESIASGQGVLGVDGRPMSLYAPGLPALLALPARWGAAEEAARWMNLLLLAVLVGLLCWWLSRLVRLPVAVGAAGLAAVSVPVLEVHSWLWSEPVFLLLATVWLALLVRIAQARERVRRLVVLAGVLAALATLVRYSGVALGPTAALVLLTRAAPFRRRLADCLLYGAVVAVPVGAWLVRNVVVTGELTGERVANAAGFEAIARQGLTTVGDWFLPPEPAAGLRLLALTSLLVVVGLLGAWVVRRWPPASDGRRAVLTVGGTFVLVTFGAMVVMAGRTNVDPLSNRLLSPLVVPLLAVAAVAVDVALDGLPRRRAVALGALSLVALGTASLGHASVGVVLGGRGEASYNSAAWRDADLVALLEAVPEDGTTISNQQRGLHYLLGSAVHNSPRRVHHASTVPVLTDIPLLVDRIAAGPVHLVWLGDPGRSRYHHTTRALDRQFDLEVIARTSAGSVYRVRCPSSGCTDTR